MGRSPDKADAFVLTFAEPVFERNETATFGNGNVPIEEIFALQNTKESKW